MVVSSWVDSAAGCWWLVAETFSLQGPSSPSGIDANDAIGTAVMLLICVSFLCSQMHVVKNQVELCLRQTNKDAKSRNVLHFSCGTSCKTCAKKI